MIAHYLFIDDQRFVFPDGTDIDALRAEILEASKDGGRYVKLSPVGGPETDVLVNPHTSVRFETIIAEDTPQDLPVQRHPLVSDQDV